MADNTVINSGSGGDTIATDDIAGIKHQRVKVQHGADGSATDVSAASPLPVTSADGSIVSLSSGLTISGTQSLSSSYTVFVGNVPTVSISGSTTVAVTSVIPGTGATNLGKAVDSAAGATDTGVVPLAIRDDTLSALTPIEGDYTPLRVGSTGALHVEIESGSVVASGTVSITGSMTVQLTGPVSLTGSIQVSGITNTVTVGGTVSITGSHSVVISNVPTVSISGSTSAIIQGAAAHDAAVSGNPVLVGLEARTTNPTAVGNGDAVRAMADDMGRQIVMPGGPRDLTVTNHVSLSVSTTITLLPAGGAGVFRDLLSLTISNPATAAATVTVWDGLVAGAQTFKWELAGDGGGVVMVFNTPFKQATANNGWAITSTETSVVATAQALDTV